MGDLESCFFAFNMVSSGEKNDTSERKEWSLLWGESVKFVVKLKLLLNPYMNVLWPLILILLQTF